MSLYETSVPLFQQVLGSFPKIVAKASAFCEAKRVDPATLMSARLFPDMYGLDRQFYFAVMHSAGAVAKVLGQTHEAPTAFATFEEAGAAVEAASAYLAGVTPAALDAAAGNEVTLKFPAGQLDFIGRDFITTFAIPNFYFHTTTVYAILRTNGVDLGKRDYLGAPKLKGA